jgi:hypothetical protein
MQRQMYSQQRTSTVDVEIFYVYARTILRRGVCRA